MKAYSSPKQALLEAGRIVAITKGRISRDNNEWLDEQIASGKFTVSGMSVQSSPSTGATPARPIVQRAVNVGAKVITDTPDVFRDEDMWDVADENGKSLAPLHIGMRNIDNVCNQSFTYCRCRAPRIFHDREIMVTFIPKGKKK